MLDDLTISELCKEIHNYFDHEKHNGHFVIENGNITADFLREGQCFRIMGSVFSDGVHRYPAADLPSEAFDGAVWALAIPKAVLTLAEEIKDWRAKYEGADSQAMSPFTSESFAGYSYSKGGAGGSGSSGGSGATGWKAAFASRLNAWRKLHE